MVKCNLSWVKSETILVSGLPCRRHAESLGVCWGSRGFTALLLRSTLSHVRYACFDWARRFNSLPALRLCNKNCAWWLRLSRAFYPILNPHFFVATRLEINDSRFTGRKPTVLKSNNRELKAWFSFVVGDFTVSRPFQSLRSNVEGDGNENGKKSNRLRLAKQQLCTWITLFCTFLCRHCTTATWKCLEREHKTTTFFFFSCTSIQSFGIQLQKKWRI